MLPRTWPLLVIGDEWREGSEHTMDKSERGGGLRAAGLGDYYAFNHPQPWLSNGNLRPLESFRFAITTAEGF